MYPGIAQNYNTWLNDLFKRAILESKVKQLKLKSSHIITLMTVP